MSYISYHYTTTLLLQIDNCCNGQRPAASRLVEWRYIRRLKAKEGEMKHEAGVQSKVPTLHGSRRVRKLPSSQHGSHHLSVAINCLPSSL